MSRTQTQIASSPEIQLRPLPTAKSTPLRSPSLPALERRIPPSNPPTAPSPPPASPLASSPPPTLRLISSLLAFFTAGLNDGSLSPLLPYILRHYALSPSSAAYLYLSSFLGWFIVALTNSHITAHLGVPGSLLLGSLLQVLAQGLRGWAPPWALLAATWGVVSLGQALQDSAANTFVAGVGGGAHRWLGAVHAGYGVGCMVGGLVGAAVAGGGEGWWARFYWVAMAVGMANAGLVAWAFGVGRGGMVEERTVEEAENEGGEDWSRNKRAWEGLKKVLKNNIVWAISLFYFFHLGAVITFGGWLVEFLVTVRDAPLAHFSYVSTGLMGGVALGRILLAEPTHRFGEKKMLLLYSVLALALQIIFWQVRDAIVDSVMATLMGFLLGPFFAAGISVATKLIPHSLHPPALGLIFVIAQAGGNLFPAITGIIANKAGVGVLQPIIVGLIAAMGISWAMVPKVERRDE